MTRFSYTTLFAPACSAYSSLPVLLVLVFALATCGSPSATTHTAAGTVNTQTVSAGTPLDGMNPAEYRQATERIIETATSTHRAYERLAWFTDYYPHRLSGSTMLEEAIEWTLQELERDGIPEIRTQEVEVPHWVRGQEYLRLETPYVRTISMLGLGGSVGTGGREITARTVVVESFEELQARRDEVPGAIVVYNQEFTNYGATVQCRVRGADQAAKYGAAAALLRAVSSNSMGHPHTGNIRYSGEVQAIPFASISAEDAMLLHRFDRRNDAAVVTLYMEAQTMPEMALSHNVIAEIPGRERPDEVVVIGGHIDSWDVGHGAMDDGSGVIVTWEALRILQELGLQPRRTIRLVLWTNEENGVMGGRAYRDKVVLNGELKRHQLALEVDAGVFEPLGFGFTGSDDAFEMLSSFMELFEPMGGMHLRRGSAGTVDLGPLRQEGAPIMGLDVETDTYFWYHHSAKDTIDKLDPDEVARSVAAVAVLAYLAAEIPERLPW